MLVNTANIRSLGVAFSAAYANGLGMAVPQWSSVATEVMSTTRENEYGWLGMMPSMRKWLGDRVVNRAAGHEYSIVNEDFELTIGVKRNDIEDDNIGMYNPLFNEMGRSTAAHPDEEVFGLLKRAFDEACYDGQPFFDTEHPVLDKAGKTILVSNSGGGSGTPWYLLDDTRALKPLIRQVRKKPEFVAKDNVTDDNVFDKKEFVYGVDSRDAVGFGFWQMGFGSKQTLNAAAYAAARAAMHGMKGDYGRPLGLKPSLLVVPPSLEGAALEILNAERNAAGETNVWKGTAKLLVVPWLA
jgi:phage major head subunit gpT-like protein